MKLKNSNNTIFDVVHTHKHTRTISCNSTHKHRDLLEVIKYHHHSCSSTHTHTQCHRDILEVVVVYKNTHTYM